MLIFVARVGDLDRFFIQEANGKAECVVTADLEGFHATLLAAGALVLRPIQFILKLNRYFGCNSTAVGDIESINFRFFAKECFQ